MSDFVIEWNADRILGSLAKPFREANEILGNRFLKEITSNKWSWPTQPSPRDIVDLGQLRNSYDGRSLTPDTYEHSWNTEYAMAVHEGAKFKDGRTMKARKWTRLPLKQGILETAFAKLAGPELERIR